MLRAAGGRTTLRGERFLRPVLLLEPLEQAGEPRLEPEQVHAAGKADGGAEQAADDVVSLRAPA